MMESGRRSILVLVNPRSGLRGFFDVIHKAMDRWWDTAETDVFYQFSRSPEDGMAKARRAAEEGFRTVLAVGGDGTISTIGRALMGTDTALGVIPTGSGNGLARHFGIPLVPETAVQALADGTSRLIDVGIVDQTPFFVTCSMAWDASIAKTFESYPIRGILPYVLAGVQEWFEYRPQDMEVEVDGEMLSFEEPLLFTVANLSQYGGGAKIAPMARADDGYLELVVALRRDAPRLVAHIHKLFDGSLHRLPELFTRRFQRLVVRRTRPAPIQVDGDAYDAGQEIEVHLKPLSLKILVP